MIKGRIGVVGGSHLYTGAPYFSAMAALKMGVDIVHVFTEKTAAKAIKTYSPDLIIHSFLHENIEIKSKKFLEWLDKLHCLVIGPGVSHFFLTFSWENLKHLSR